MANKIYRLWAEGAPTMICAQGSLAGWVRYYIDRGYAPQYRPMDTDKTQERLHLNTDTKICFSDEDHI